MKGLIDPEAFAQKIQCKWSIVMIKPINKATQIQELKVNKIGSVDDSEIEETSIYLDNGNNKLDSNDHKLSIRRLGARRCKQCFRFRD